MNSATSTEGNRAAATGRDGIRPWQFFTLAGLACAFVATYFARGRGPEAVALQIVLMVTAALVGLAMLTTVLPLFGSRHAVSAPVGRRTRAALERDKTLTLRAIKDLEFDRAMGKLSDADFTEMSARLRSRAARLIKQLDEGSGYREQIEHDLRAKLAAGGTGVGVSDGKRSPGSAGAADTTVLVAGVGGRRTAIAPEGSARTCGSCMTVNDVDARFCKACGTPL